MGGQPWHPSMPLSLGETTNLCASQSHLFVCLLQHNVPIRLVCKSLRTMASPCATQLQILDTFKKAVEAEVTGAEVGKGKKETRVNDAIGA